MRFLFFLSFLLNCFCSEFCNPHPGTPSVQPIGKARGIKPGRVAWIYNQNACKWDGESKYWWDSKHTDSDKVYDMIDQTILSVGGEEKSGNVSNAWNKIFTDFNEKKHKVSKGYVKGEKIAIKLNLNGYVGYENVDVINTISPVFVKMLLRNILKNNDIDQKDIVLFDPSRWLQPQFVDLDEFPDVKWEDAEGGMDYVTQAKPDFDVDFFFSNKSVPSWDTSKLPKCLTTSKYLIQINAFRGHTVCGMTENAKNWFGSIYRPDNVCTFYHNLPQHWCPISLHPWVNITGTILAPPMGDVWGPKRGQPNYDIFVDLTGHDHTANGKGLLFFIDGLYGGIAQTGVAPPVKFQNTPFLDNWSCSLFASQDFVALDSVAFDFLRVEPEQIWVNKGCTDNYLHESSQANNPPSGAVYKPSGKQLDSLGVHEHWNNEKEKKYSRNLGVGEGIELVQLHEI